MYKTIMRKPTSNRNIFSGVKAIGALRLNGIGPTSILRGSCEIVFHFVTKHNKRALVLTVV